MSRFSRRVYRRGQRSGAFACMLGVIGPEQARRDCPATAPRIRRAHAACSHPVAGLSVPPKNTWPTALWSATSRVGKMSGWPQQNSRYTSAVHGPIPFTAGQCRIAASAASISAQRVEIGRARRDRPRQRASSVATLGRDSPAARISSSPSLEISPCRGRRAQQGVQPTQDRIGAGARHHAARSTIDTRAGRPGAARRSGSG
jgi:hypothetical protein